MRQVSPALDAYEFRRLLIVGACVSTAAAANYAGSTLPQPTLVAVGSAVLGILLVLRRRPPVAAGSTPALIEEPVAVEPPNVSGETAARQRRLRAGRAELLAIAASLSSAERRLEEHEARLVSLSGRQSLLHVDARDKLADFDTRLDRLEARIAETEEQARSIAAHHIEVLEQLNEYLAEHRQALLDLAEGDD